MIFQSYSYFHAIATIVVDIELFMREFKKLSLKGFLHLILQKS